MLIDSILLPGVVFPAASALAVLVAAGAWGRRAPGRGLVGSGAAVGVALLVAYVAASGWPRFPPVESTQRLFFWVALISVVALIWGGLKAGAPPWPLPAAAVLFLLWGMLRSPIEHRWAHGETALWLGGLLLLGLVLHHALRASLAVAPKGAALIAAVVRLILFGGIAVTLGLSGTARLAQLMGAVACGALLVELVARWRGRPGWRPADAMVLTVIVLGLLLGGYFFAELAWLPAILLLGAVLLLGWAAKRRRAWRFLPLLPLGLAVIWTVMTWLEQPEDPYGEYYGRLPAGFEVGSDGNFASRTA